MEQEKNEGEAVQTLNTVQHSWGKVSPMQGKMRAEKCKHDLKCKTVLKMILDAWHTAFFNKERKAFPDLLVDSCLCGFFGLGSYGIQPEVSE